MSPEELKHGEDLKEAGERVMTRVWIMERKIGESRRQLWPTL